MGAPVAATLRPWAGDGNRDQWHFNSCHFALLLPRVFFPCRERYELRRDTCPVLSPHCCCQGQNHPPSCLLASGMAITKSALTNGALSITQRGTHPIGMGPSWLPTPPPRPPRAALGGVTPPTPPSQQRWIHILEMCNLCLSGTCLDTGCCSPRPEKKSLNFMHELHSQLSQ